MLCKCVCVCCVSVSVVCVVSGVLCKCCASVCLLCKCCAVVCCVSFVYMSVRAEHPAVVVTGVSVIPSAPQCSGQVSVQQDVRSSLSHNEHR